ncbi:MAG: ABC transporter substrate-binding protein [Olsenella sp.]|jgi:NitT/TauT family transport system substrate-binding protein
MLDRRNFVKLAMGLAVAVPIAGCSSSSPSGTGGSGSSSEQKDDYTVRIPMSTSMCAAPMHIAAINGYFDQVGLKWESVPLGDNSSLDIVASGKADISYDLLQTLVQRIANGLDYQVISGVHYGCIKIVASKASGITDVSGLKGKKIGVPTSLGSDPAVMLQRVLTNEGIGCTADNMEVDMQVFQNSDLEASLTNGSIDAFVSWDPYASLVSKNDGCPIIWDQTTGELTKDEYCCFVGCTTAFKNDHTDELKKVCEALQMACDYIVQDPANAVKLMVDNNYVSLKDQELAAKLLASYKYGLATKKGKESFRHCAQQLSDLGIISLKQSIDDFTDDHYPTVDGIDYSA